MGVNECYFRCLPACAGEGRENKKKDGVAKTSTTFNY